MKKLLKSQKFAQELDTVVSYYSVTFDLTTIVGGGHGVYDVPSSNTFLRNLLVP